MCRGRSKERTSTRDHRQLTPTSLRVPGWKSHYVCPMCMKGSKSDACSVIQRKCGICQQPLMYVSIDFKMPSRKTKSGRREWAFVNQVDPKGPISQDYHDGQDPHFFRSIKEM